MENPGIQTRNPFKMFWSLNSRIKDKRLIDVTKSSETKCFIFTDADYKSLVKINAFTPSFSCVYYIVEIKVQW